jgi:hypothetical protein
MTPAGLFISNRFVSIVGGGAGRAPPSFNC